MSGIIQITFNKIENRKSKIEGNPKFRIHKFSNQDTFVSESVEIIEMFISEKLHNQKVVRIALSGD